jgi:hypothetical protein
LNVAKIRVSSCPLPKNDEVESCAVNKSGQNLRSQNKKADPFLSWLSINCQSAIGNSLCPEFTPIDLGVFCQDVFQSGRDSAPEAGSDEAERGERMRLPPENRRLAAAKVFR